MKRKRKADIRKILADACIAESDRQFRRALDLRDMDPIVAQAALRIFIKPEIAAAWLTKPLRVLGFKAPVECPKAEVLHVLGHLAHGVFG